MISQHHTTAISFHNSRVMNRYNFARNKGRGMGQLNTPAPLSAPKPAEPETRTTPAVSSQRASTETTPGLSALTLSKPTVSFGDTRRFADRIKEETPHLQPDQVLMLNFLRADGTLGSPLRLMVVDVDGTQLGIPLGKVSESGVSTFYVRAADVDVSTEPSPVGVPAARYELDPPFFTLYDVDQEVVARLNLLRCKDR